MSKLRLTFACGPYDRTLALRDGSVQPEGIELNYIASQPPDIFWRMLQFNEFEISEMSLSNYVTLVGAEKAPFIAIPAFPSRVFRHGYFFINTEKGIKTPADLKGKRGGVPEYTMTAALYMRGLLQHEYGVKPSDVEWVQGRADRLGRKLPADVRLTQAPPGTELGDLLERGEIDFMMTANNPLAFRRGSPKVRRLFPNYPELEKDYYRRTKIYPIMHTVVIRNDVYERNPWVALSMCRAACGAKEHAYHLLADMGSPKVSSAWLQPLLEEERAILGPDWFAYGIEPNRPSIEALLQYTHEHGLTDRRVKLEELFAPSTIRDIPLSEGQHVERPQIEEDNTMTIPQLMPWIGGPVKFEAGLSPLVCPIDESVASHMIESDAKVVDVAARHAHAAFLAHQDATTAKRVEWLLAAADAIDKI